MVNLVGAFSVVVGSGGGVGLFITLEYKLGVGLLLMLDWEVSRLGVICCCS